MKVHCNQDVACRGQDSYGFPSVVLEAVASGDQRPALSCKALPEPGRFGCQFRGMNFVASYCHNLPRAHVLCDTAEVHYRGGTLQRGAGKLDETTSIMFVALRPCQCMAHQRASGKSASA